MYASTGCMDMARRGHSWLGLTDGVAGHLGGVDCEILAQDFNRIDRIFIPPRYTIHSRSPTAKNSGVKRAWPGAISGWLKIHNKIFLKSKNSKLAVVVDNFK
jgi:hypothetical protein